MKDKKEFSDIFDDDFEVTYEDDTGMTVDMSESRRRPANSRSHWKTAADYDDDFAAADDDYYSNDEYDDDELRMIMTAGPAGKSVLLTESRNPKNGDLPAGRKAGAFRLPPRSAKADARFPVLPLP